MKDLETYNRVPSLESPLLKSSVFALYVALTFIAIGGSIKFIVVDNSVLLSLATLCGAAALFVLVYIYDSTRTHYCQFCSGKLVSIIRPLILTNKFLAMTGSKRGDFFFTYCSWGKIPFVKRWTKISNRSLACHHCRLAETKQFAFHEPLDDMEAAQINQNQP